MEERRAEGLMLPPKEIRCHTTFNQAIQHTSAISQANSHQITSDNTKHNQYSTLLP